MTPMLSLMLALMTATPATQAQDAPVPPACAGPTFVSWQACAEAAQPGSPAYVLAMMNLGTDAYLRGDLGAALDFYDKADRDGFSMTSDVTFHTFRADARRYGGRLEEARADARIAWGFLEGRPPANTPPNLILPINTEMRGAILSIILPIMKDDDPEAFRHARDQYLTLPASDWVALSRRAGVLTSLGENEAAVAASKAALDLRPADPLSKNNHCYALVEAGRADEALPYCEGAVAGLPELAPVRHSLATVLARLGRCADAEAQLAVARRLEPGSSLYREALTCTPKAG
jgi:tetratricopeptide (TPR) repeat protein